MPATRPCVRRFGRSTRYLTRLRKQGVIEGISDGRGSKWKVAQRST